MQSDVTMSLLIGWEVVGVGAYELSLLLKEFRFLNAFKIISYYHANNQTIASSLLNACFG
jgi:hypothetical protein